MTGSVPPSALGLTVNTSITYGLPRRCLLGWCEVILNAGPPDLSEGHWNAEVRNPHVVPSRLIFQSFQRFRPERLLMCCFVWAEVIRSQTALLESLHARSLSIFRLQKGFQETHTGL